VRINAAQRIQNENRILAAMDRLLGGEIPPGGNCDVKTLRHAEATATGICCLGTPRELSNSPCLHLAAESDSAEFTCTPDGSNARTTLQIRQVRMLRLPVKSVLFALPTCFGT
jgi:hypothetical protein